MTRKTALTPDQVRQQLRQRGKTLSTWAAERGYDRKAVYRVMSGTDKAYYGNAHNIAVALGLKVAEEEPSTTAIHSNTQKRAAA
ncbi:MAG: DNA-binding protein [Rhodanobacter sp.]